MIRKLIRCSACNQVIPDYEGCLLNRAQHIPGVEWSGADLAEAKTFLRKHSHHPLEQLSIETDSIIGENPAYEPIGVAYILASNTGNKFLIRRTRMALDQPASYDVIPGKLKLFNVALRVQEYDLRKQIAADKRFSPLLKRKMEKLIEAFREEIAGIGAEDFSAEAEAIEEGETSLIAYGSLKDYHWTRILKRCIPCFKESELKLVREFIEDNRIPPDVLSVQIQRRISILQTVSLESRERTSKKDEIGMAVDARSDAIGERKSAKNNRRVRIEL